MGEVYRATDTKLGRDVALKVLPADMAQDPERLARFRREARAVAALSHPNVVTLYSVEECDGIHFLTMELVEGVSLDCRISTGGLPVEQIVEVAGALAEALAAAHEKGIVHRDLKPANVMITNEGRVKVLDFGLAKDVSTEGSNEATMTSAGYTQSGIVIGTPAYMSPEQVSGRALDHRTDIFSLGVVLHEMSTGQRPFEGTSSAELISSILRDNPPLVTDVRSDLPFDVARVIRRCLEKDPRHRVQTARDVSNEFRDLSRLTVSKSTSASTSSTHASPAADSGAARAAEGFWVAVLPFRYTGANAELAALAEGLTEDVVTGLSRFSYLRVIARGSTSRYANTSVDVRSAGKELGARYVMEGSLRQAGTKLRLAVQLVDAVSGAHLWAENYERTFSPEDIFALQDDLVPRIVATVADQHGVLAHSMSNLIRNKRDEQLSPYEVVLRVFSLHERMSPEEHASVRTLLERTVQSAPDAADCWAMLATIYCDEYMFGFPGQPDPLGRSQAAAQRAIEIEPSNWLASQAVAQSLFFRREWHAFRPVAERTIALNRMDGAAQAFIGMLLALSGEWKRGCEVAEAARQLNPHHPGWYWLPMVFNAYREHDYRASVDAALRINMPGYFWGPATSAAAFGQLDEQAHAQKAVKELLAIRPDFATTAQQEFAKWFDDDLAENYLAGLRKAGLEMVGHGTKPPSGALAAKAHHVSGEVRADEGFWVAVLPFKYSGSNADLTALAEGLTEDIVTGLSRFSYLKVIARSSTARYAREVVDVRTAAKELGARYLMEGSVRQAGAKVRIAVHLVDATSGAGLWAETYDRPFTLDAELDLVDDVVPRIVCTVADTQGILPHSMTEALRTRDPETLTPYEALLRSFGHFQRVTASEHLAARTALERAVKQPPDRGDCWAILAMLYREEYTHGFNLQPDPLGRALAAARRALDVAPSNHIAHAALASTLFFRKEFGAFRAAAERAVALNSMDGLTASYLGMQLAFSGDWDRGCFLAERATQLNPNHPGWYWFPACFNAYRQRDYHRALEIALRINLPGFWRTQFALAAIHGQLGEQDAARYAIKELLKIRPDFAQVGEAELRKWWNLEFTEHLIDGLRKAGLKLSSE
jgi:TolB-like protein/cytochrome c-type biogenesis protein CcmH/NrfG